MLSRLARPSLLGAPRLAAGGLNMVQPAQARTAVTFIASYEDTRTSMKFFSNHLNKCGSDEYPGFRKEYMKPKEKRYRRNKAKIGKQANYKVRGLVEFINFKRANKYN